MGGMGGRVDNVTLSKRLTNSPVLVVASAYGYSAQQEKVMKAQAFGNKDQMAFMMGGKSLEINPHHPVVHDLLKKVKEGDAGKEQAKGIAEMLFQTAMIESGYEIA